MEEVFIQNSPDLLCGEFYSLEIGELTGPSSGEINRDLCDCLQCLFGSEMNHDFMFETLLCNLVL